MTARLLGAAMVIAALATGDAAAQTRVYVPPMPHAGSDGSIRVTVDLTIRGAAAPAAVADQLAAEETVRHALYDAANKECALLQSVFHRECAPISVSVVGGRSFGPTAPPLTDTLRAEFMLAPAKSL